MSDKYLPPEDFIDLLMYMIPDKKELEGEHTNNGGNSALEAYRRFTVIRPINYQLYIY
jgi:hypothetical protein